MQVLALVDSPSHVCCRYRLSAFQDFFRREGHSLGLHTIPKSIWGRWQLFGSLSSADVVIVQRKLFPRWQLPWLRRSGPCLIFDFDDAVFLRDSYARKGLQDARRMRGFRAILRACDVAIAGNDFLATHARDCAPNLRVEVIPTCVNPSGYPMAKHSQTQGKGKLGWIGSGSTLQGIEQSRCIWEGIGKTSPGASLRLICDRSLALDHLSVEFCPWTLEGEARAIAECDVGISWIPDDDWSRGKCGLKVLQYFAAGLPVIANPVGVHREMIEPGVNGFLAQSPEEWQSAVQQLLGNPQLRRQMGQAARRKVEQQYSVSLGADRWINLLNSLRTKRRRTG